MRDAVNKAARLVINYCLEQGIGIIVFGWNKWQRQEVNLGSKTNQNFVQIPTTRLKKRIAKLCEQFRFVEKASFLDHDFLPEYGEKPHKWKESGKGLKRGLYRTANNLYINADANGAANILKNVKVTLGLNLDGVSSGALTTPLRVRFWATEESPWLPFGNAKGEQPGECQDLIIIAKDSSPMTNLEDNQQSEFEQELEELETDLRLLKERYAQVQQDHQKKAQWQQELKNPQQNKNQTPEVKEELKRIQKQLQVLELNLESQLFSWNSLKRPFWQFVRFGGLGVIIGWLLRSWIS
jgi:IS605 OrfB family transposase